MDAKYLADIQNIADTYGNGTVHLTIRQGFEIPGIPYEKMDEVNQLLQPIIEGLNINQEEPGNGYTASGTRNIMACVGNSICPYGCYDTTAFARKMEKAIFPNDLHFKVCFTGCSNDCAKVRMHDFGIIGMTQPQFEADRCISCGACSGDSIEKVFPRESVYSCKSVFFSSVLSIFDLELGVVAEQPVATTVNESINNRVYSLFVILFVLLFIRDVSHAFLYS